MPNFTDSDHFFMRRALDLALRGGQATRPNPLVGCVVTHQGRCLGEGWHERFGGPHAEVNALAAVPAADRQWLPQSRIYVTLEPCAHHGKTPPCADLLIREGVGEVVICNRDPNPLVAGQGIGRLRAADIQVETGLLETEGRWLNRRFFTMQEKQRPYLVLKWAETADGFLAGPYFQPVQISGEQARLLTHKWRTEEAAILVGTRTALHDNPRLNAREWPGPQPVRAVIDKNLSLPPTHHLFDQSQPTLVYTYRQRAPCENVEYITLTEPGHGPGQVVDLLPQMLADLHRRGLQSVLVEGGPTVLNSLLAHDLWDEMRVFRSRARQLGAGIAAPKPGLSGLQGLENAGDDELLTWLNS
ncbi:bifunctional diaminohydroxyphosphoribosylaminopyrimidine deaminase/5-amino-6-(5-phosphoribosylamino)uracil reductase RibD [uncultured Hymenobacter sp.]|uniref:bifunctional diaminohydroxyphosphoribosylaminopyrimidine deaminase/5-amino-6-(5-phosphoribosylamino)uracil reductase RibD n=1 Tax=uncultured Hymenobacter sp. TaxID=170016 RepID=UPI0035CB24EF